MAVPGLVWFSVAGALCLASSWILLRWGMRWGATPQERARRLPGDEYLEGGARARVAMTRAVYLRAPPERVWPWIEQAGRGAGWYSYDWIDNGGRASARHIVSWIPEPQEGDATAIGYLREIRDGQSLVWWLDSVGFAGARARLVVFYGIEPEGEGTRLLARMSADASGVTARIALFVFAVMDSIMARRQLLGIRERVESELPHEQETGARDQYQLYEALFADGESAGIVGKEQTARWRRKAIEDGVLDAD
ncbi:MAG: hypothetical protein ACYTGZ_13415 [Planctomycetota bacterium]|jgi:hypothetical protein